MDITSSKKDAILKTLSDYLRHNGLNNTPKGRRLFEAKSVEMKSMDWEKTRALFTVKSETNPKIFFSVRLNGFDTSSISSTCNCSYDMDDLCMHEVAALYLLRAELNEMTVNDVLPPSAFEAVKIEVPDNGLLKITALDTQNFLNFLSWSDFNAAQELVKTDKVEQLTIGNNKATFNVVEDIRYKVSVKKLEGHNVLTQCSCTDETRKVCIHKGAVLYYIGVHFGIDGLNLLKNWDEEKGKLLSEYGYTLEEDLHNKFEFSFDEKGLRMIVLDKALQKIPGTEGFFSWSKAFINATDTAFFKIKEIKKGSGTEELLYVLIVNDESKFPDTSLQVLVGKRKKDGSFYKANVLYDTFPDKEILFLDQTDKQLLQIATQLNSRILLASYLPSAAGKEYVYRVNVNDDAYEMLQLRIGEGLTALFTNAGDKQFYISKSTGNDSLPDVDADKTYTLSVTPLNVYMVFAEDNEHYILRPAFMLGNEKQTLNSFIKISKWLWVKDGVIYKMASFNEVKLLDKFEEQLHVKFRKGNFTSFFNDVIKPISQKNNVMIEDRPVTAIKGIKPSINLYLKEYDKFLLLLPRFEYADGENKEEAEMYSANDLLFTRDDSVFSIERDAQIEETQIAFFKTLHPDFERNLYQEFFHVPFDMVMKDGWFFKLFDKLKEHNINVYGQSELKKIRYNYNRPNLQFKASSGIDWLDMQIQVTFGDVDLPLAELRKAIINKQKFVSLSDGSIGVLPEDWIERYSPLFRFGKVDKNNVSISKLHFSIIDAYLDELNNDKLKQELDEKKQKLLSFDSVTPVPVPANISATLRHYQESGFHWLNFLDEFGWGGCLADDMGLGKTLQVLTLLQQLKNKGELKTCLVVMPTTLIFNWNNEIEKYTEGLKVLTHRGVDRDVNHDVFAQYDIVLTTYGTLRSDISDFKDFEFHYIILDESQAIKNPSSQISKAVRVLKAKNRLVMTGTPIENNTFDLYAQLEFLNPGFLGSQDFFRSEFATPIDKNANEEKAKELRKLIAPFVLKRTKEEVAKDLPEKTETILYCEMGKDQRKVYDAFRHKYRDQIINKIEKDGISKSGFLILEGLLKLRMICDSPALVANDESDFGNSSVKLDELVREISENAGHHKILVFSQFLKMLDLVKQELVALNIPYEYLDGQTTDRKDRIENFQNDDNVRVFLMSLKAGGVGINLTEADYVYLVDPWWNPAVEQQAIDRTHRLGQKKNVFAYKMICKDSIEEKIMLLQDKKKTLASNLIDVEKNIMKKLNKEDIEMLFG